MIFQMIEKFQFPDILPSKKLLRRKEKKLGKFLSKIPAWNKVIFQMIQIFPDNSDKVGKEEKVGPTVKQDSSAE